MLAIEANKNNSYDLTKAKTSALISKETVDQVLAFHESLGNKKTPLIQLSGLANDLGVQSIFIKDESHRLGLNAFKGLGASYAMSRQLEKNSKIIPLDLYQIFDYLREKKLSDDLPFIKYGDESFNIPISLVSTEAILNENLGVDEYTDVITIGYSSTDYIGHNFGILSLETQGANPSFFSTKGKDVRSVFFTSLSLSIVTFLLSQSFTKEEASRILPS